jgi:hypothetical protein
MLTPHRFGAYHDDGIYVSTAKSLAEGQGYRIISLPYEPAQTKYPPFYAWLLSLIWRIYPQFPQNITLMMLLSVVATLGFLTMTYHYLVKYGYASAWQALLVVGLAAINWRLMILATSIYSEMVYAVLTVIGLHLAERYEKQKWRWSAGVLLSFILGVTLLTRTSGVALLFAVVVFYLIKRQWWRAISIVGLSSVFIIGWVVWCNVNKTHVEGVNVAYYTSYLGHLSEVVRDLQAQNDSSKLAVFLNIAFENFVGGILISVPLICSGINYSWIPNFSGLFFVIALGFSFLILLLIVAGFIRQVSKKVRLLHLYLISCMGLYLFWLPGVSYDRFLMPLLPFFLLFLVSELSRMVSKVQREPSLSSTTMWKGTAVFIGFLIFSLTVVILYNYGVGIYQSVALLEKSANRDAEDAQAIAWINANTNPSDTLVCYRDPKYFLYTGHKATRSFPMKEGVSWQDDPSTLDNLSSLIFRLMDEANGRYLIVTSTDFELEDAPDLHRKTFNQLIEQHPEKFTLVFVSADGNSKIFQVKNDAK